MLRSKAEVLEKKKVYVYGIWPIPLSKVTDRSAWKSLSINTSWYWFTRSQTKCTISLIKRVHSNKRVQALPVGKRLSVKINFQIRFQSRDCSSRSNIGRATVPQLWGPVAKLRSPLVYRWDSGISSKPRLGVLRGLASNTLSY